MLTHGDAKYSDGSLLAVAADWDRLRVEHRQVGPGLQACVTPECTELVHILSGQARVRRRADGQLQDGMALPGTSWLVPAGTDETLLDLDGTTECLIVFLPAKPLDDVAANGYGIDPARTRLAYAGGMVDPVLAQIGATLRGLVGAPTEPIHDLFAHSIGTALAAHLIARYNTERWQPPPRAPALDPRRLHRVLELIEARLGERLTLDEMAAEACLSPFHFCRLFTETTGRSPHRYLVDRRIEAAQRMLRDGADSLAGVALDVGFGSQASFTRSFRRATGLTPGEFRRLNRCRALPVQAPATSVEHFARTGKSAEASAL